MKLHTYILMAGFVTASVVPVQAQDSNNSVVSWSSSLASLWNSASSAVSSWTSSAASTISVLPSETKIVLGGGLAAVGSYFGFKYLGFKYLERLNDPRHQLLSKLRQGGFNDRTGSQEDGLRPNSGYQGYDSKSYFAEQAKKEAKEQTQLMQTQLIRQAQSLHQSRTEQIRKNAKRFLSEKIQGERAQEFARDAMAASRSREAKENARVNQLIAAQDAAQEQREQNVLRDAMAASRSREAKENARVNQLIAAQEQREQNALHDAMAASGSREEKENTRLNQLIVAQEQREQNALRDARLASGRRELKENARLTRFIVDQGQRELSVLRDAMAASDGREEEENARINQLIADQEQREQNALRDAMAASRSREAKENARVNQLIAAQDGAQVLRYSGNRYEQDDSIDKILDSVLTELEAEDQANTSRRFRSHSEAQRPQILPGLHKRGGSHDSYLALKKVVTASMLDQRSQSDPLSSSFVVCDDPIAESKVRGIHHMECIRNGRGHTVPETLESVLDLAVEHGADEGDGFEIPDVCENITINPRDVCMRYWYKRKEEGGSVYIARNGAHVIALSQGEQQEHVLTGRASYIELYELSNGIRVRFVNEKPEEDSIWSDMRQYWNESRLGSAVNWVTNFITFWTNRITDDVRDRLQETGIDRANCMRRAAALGDTVTVGYYLMTMVDPNDTVNNTHYAGFTALHAAAENGHKNVVELLLKYGATPTVGTYQMRNTSVRGQTPIHLAASRGYLDIVKQLLDHITESNVDCLLTKMKIKDNQGNREFSALELAEKHGYVDIACAIYSKLHDILGDNNDTEQMRKAYCPANLDEIDVAWNLFGNQTAEVVERKAVLLQKAYEYVAEQLKVQAPTIAQMSYENLQRLKQTVDVDAQCIKDKTAGLNTLISNSLSSEADWYQNINGEYEAKLEIDPEECYLKLGYESWQQGVKAKANDIQNEWDQILDGLSEEDKRVLRQIGYFVRNTEKKLQFDCYIIMRDLQKKVEERGSEEFVEMSMSPEGDVDFSDPEWIPQSIHLGENKAQELLMQYFEASNGGAAMYCKEIQSMITKACNTKRQQQEDEDYKEPEQ